MKFAHIIFKRSIRTSQKTPCFSVTDINLLMHLTVKVSVGLGSYTKYIIKLYGGKYSVSKVNDVLQLPVHTAHVPYIT